MSSYILSLPAREIERRILKAASKTYLAEYIEAESLILVITDATHLIEDGSELKFRAPVACTDVTRLRVNYTSEDGIISKDFAFADANGNDIGEVDNLFAKNAIVKVILDFDIDMDGNGTGAAFVQNADTNAYLEERFKNVAAVQIITWEDAD
jgi:hypothetical protein